MKGYTPQDDDDVYFDDMDEEKSSISKLLISLFIGVFAVGGMCLLGWVFLQGKPLPLEETPLVKADKSPTKVKPQEPGGMVVANMDKTVYDNLSGNDDALQTTEKVLPSPEEPVDRIQVIAGQQKENDEGHTEETAEAKAELPPSVEAKAAPSKSSPAALSEAVKQSSGDGVRPITESDLNLVQDRPVAKAPTQSPVQEADEGGYKVQLAAFKTERDAVESWKKIQRVHMDLLGKYHYYVERKEVEGKGTFYRLQAGVIAKESEARLLCKKLSEVNQGCFVVE